MTSRDSKMKRLRLGLSAFLPGIAWGAVTVLFIFFVFRYVDLRPRVDQNFFFSSTDPQVQADRLISKIFVQEPQLILSAKGNIRSPRYLRKLRGLTNELSAIPEIDAVESLNRGPRNTDDALKSPLWKRVLFSEDRKTSFVYVWIKQKASVEKSVHKIEEAKQRLDSPDFPLIMSGAPYIIELIQRNLLRDFKIFTITAFCVFGLSGLAMSRSVAGFGIFILSGFPPTQRFGLSVVLGTLLTPLSALLVLPWFATFQLPGRVTPLIKQRQKAAP